MNLKLKTLILFVCSLIITMVPASAVQTGDVIANTEEVKNKQSNIQEDSNKISKSNENLDKHSKIIQDTVNEMNNVKWYQFWKWDFYLRQGPNKISSEGQIIESLGKDVNNTSSNIQNDANQATNTGDNSIQLALDTANEKNDINNENDSYNTGDERTNIKIIVNDLSSHFKTSYTVNKMSDLKNGDIVQYPLTHNNYVYLQFVGMSPDGNTALFLGGNGNAVRLPASDLVYMDYKITTPNSKTTTSLNSQDNNQTSLNSTQNTSSTDFTAVNYIANIQKDGLNKYNDTQVADYNNQLDNAEKTKKTGKNLKIIGGVLTGIGGILAIITLALGAGYGQIVYVLGWILAIFCPPMWALMNTYTWIIGIMGLISIGLLAAGSKLVDNGIKITDAADKQINEIIGNKNTFTDGCNVIDTDLDKYNNGASDNLPVSPDINFDIEENGNNTGTLNATDADGDGLIYMMDHQATNGTVTINQNGTYTYASNQNFTGNDSFTYKSNDIYGDSNIATVQVQVHPVNHAPVSNNLTFDIETNNNLTAELKSTDADADPIIYNLLNNTSQGNITLNPNGTFTYTPIDGFIGSETFTYAAKDWKETGNNATVQINVHPVNHAPVANDINITMGKNENIMGNLTATDEDGDPVSYNLKDKPDHGKLDLNSDGSFSYTPNQGFIGNETFTYKAKDWKNTSNIGTVKIEVNDVNHAPIVENMNLTTTINKAIVGQFQATDLDGEKQTFKVVKTTSHGTLKINGTKFTYTPTNNFNGTDSFSYQSNDGKINSNTANIIIKVTKTPTNVINTPQTPTKTPTSTYQTTAKNAKYTPTNTLNPLSQINTPIQPDKTANQNNTNMTAPQISDMLTPLENTPLQFIVPIIQKAANYIESILKI